MIVTPPINHHQLKESEIERRLMKKAVEEKEELEVGGWVSVSGSS